MKPQTLITMTGPSCAGKTTLEQMLIMAGAARVISNTSRPPRAGEVDGIDYRFRSREWFEERITRGELVEFVDFGGNYYGNTEECIKDALARGDGFAVWVIEPVGHKQVKKWAENTPAGRMVHHYSVFVDGDPTVIYNRFLSRYREAIDYSTPGHVEKQAEIFAKRLALMTTTERDWVLEAQFDLNEGHRLYDLYLERFNEANQADVVSWLRALAKNQTASGHVENGMRFNERRAA